MAFAGEKRIFKQALRDTTKDKKMKRLGFLFLVIPILNSCHGQANVANKKNEHPINTEMIVGSGCEIM